MIKAVSFSNTTEGSNDNQKEIKLQSKNKDIGTSVFLLSSRENISYLYEI
jgi:hypothetical protein